MAEEKSLLEGQPRGALADGAARLDALAREVNSRQIAQSQGLSSTAYRAPAVSPDEEWARNFATQGIGPQLEMHRISGFAPPPMPRISLDLALLPFAVAKPEAAKLDSPLAMGERLGKPEPRRSWFGRLFQSIR